MKVQDVGVAPVGQDVLADPVETVAAYESYLQELPLAWNTKIAYVGQCRAFAIWLTRQSEYDPVTVFTDPLARDDAVRDHRHYLLVERRRVPKGADLSLCALTHLFRWLGIGPPDVTYATGRRKVAPKALDERSIRAVLRAARRRNERDRALVTVFLATGLRASELAALDVDDVFVSGRKGVLEVRATPGDRARSVPLNRQARQALNAWIVERRRWRGAGQTNALFLTTATGVRMPNRSVRYIVNQVGHEAKLDGLSPLVLRHTFGSVLARYGVDISLIAELMGHTSVQTTAIYTMPTEEQVAEQSNGSDRGR